MGRVVAYVEIDTRTEKTKYSFTGNPVLKRIRGQRVNSQSKQIGYTHKKEQN